MERMACRSGTWVILKRAILSVVAMEQVLEHASLSRSCAAAVGPRLALST